VNLAGWATARGRTTRTPASSYAETDAVLIPCRDGKARRTQPGIFPLLPGRVGLLRGYGNAIVPQVAAAFVEAYLEARGER
jgi:DNA (cytosine-5)-methyltransferase 1